MLTIIGIGQTHLQWEGLARAERSPDCSITRWIAVAHSKLCEEGFLVRIEQPDIVDPVPRHGEPIDPHAKRESLVSLRIEPAVTQELPGGSCPSPGAPSIDRGKTRRPRRSAW